MNKDYFNAEVPMVMGNLKKQKSIGTFYSLETPCSSKNALNAEQ